MVKEFISQLPPDKLSPFAKHPYRVREDAAMDELVESIRVHGVLSPLLARPKGECYELVSGHRRRLAAQKLGLPTVPVLVREMTDDEAVILMVDSNLQRENLLPSEKAFAYRMKLEAMSRQGHRSDLTSDQLGRKLETAEIIAQQSDDSKSQVRRYIRLTYLIPEFLEKMDKGEIALSVGVELSFLDESIQREVLEQCAINDCTPSYSQAWRMHKADREGALTKAVIQTIMSEEKANQKVRLKIPMDRIRKYFPQSYTTAQIEDAVVKLCERDYRRRTDRER